MNHWDEEAEVVIVGYGGAGAFAAIAARGAGAKVLVLERQPANTSTKSNHTPSTRLSGGAWLCFTDEDKAITYLEGLARISNEALDDDRRKMIRVFAKHLVSDTPWVKDIGVPIGGNESIRPLLVQRFGEQTKVTDNRMFVADFPDLPGAEGSFSYLTRAEGELRSGAAFFRVLYEAIQKRNIPVMWETRAVHLVAPNGEIQGVIALSNGKEKRIRANRGVILTCGGFEFNARMKEDYLKVSPTYFVGNPDNTGDGITMTMEIGANLWHMNACSWRCVMKYPGLPAAFSTQRHETASFFVDKRGRRFTNERCKMHGVGYELTGYDCYAMTYPRVPFYWIFGETRRKLAPLASYHGICNPPGGVTGDIYYVWSEDNQKEIDKGWIIRANTIEELAGKILAEPDNNGLMSGNTLKATLEQYNRFCDKGCDDEFRKAKEWLQPVDGPPYYAVKLWPGGPNTEGGPKRNVNGQCPGGPSGPIPR
ncbi:MAG: FAD-dependent oxidoreductase [Chloroflexi bacterium]|nr:FAD-dependent oxidoreductase [Chloroflexota bacterium]